MGPAILGSLAGVLATALIGLTVWALKQAFSMWRDIADIKGQLSSYRHLAEDQEKVKEYLEKVKEQLSVYRHLLTQIILRIEWLEEHAPRPHKHQSMHQKTTNLLDLVEDPE